MYDIELTARQAELLKFVAHQIVCVEDRFNLDDMDFLIKASLVMLHNTDYPGYFSITKMGIECLIFNADKLSRDFDEGILFNKPTKAAIASDFWK